MIVDAHSHLLANFTPCDALKESPDEVQEFDLPSFDARCEELEVLRVVTLAQEMVRIQRQWLGSHALLAAFQQLRPERVIAMAGAEPLDKRDLLNEERLSEVEGWLQGKSLCGLLLTPPYGHYYANDARCYPFYELAQRTGVPVYLHHSAQYGEPSLAPMKFARPWLFDEVAADFPQVTFVIEHMGFPWSEELFALMCHCENVWTDVSALWWRPHVLAWNLTMARDYGLLERVVWGTDYVGDNVNEWANSVQTETAWLRSDLNLVLEGCGWPTMSEEGLDGLLCRNACRLLQIETA